MVLPYEMRSGVAPAASASWVSLNGCDVEAATDPDQELEDLRRRIGLHRVEHFAVWQRLGKVQIVLAHDIEVDARGRVRLQCDA
jgi:hypothetical protein